MTTPFSIESLRGDDPRLHDILARAREFIADCRETIDDEPLNDEQAEVVERIAQDHIGAALLKHDPEIARLREYNKRLLGHHRTSGDLWMQMVMDEVPGYRWAEIARRQSEEIEILRGRAGIIQEALRWADQIVTLSDGWDKDGSLESVGRIAMDYAPAIRNALTRYHTTELTPTDVHEFALALENGGWHSDDPDALESLGASLTEFLRISRDEGKA